MAAAPQEWLESSFALLERLESERNGLTSALAELDQRLDNLHRGVDHASVMLGDMHHEQRQIEDLRGALAHQAEELDAAQSRLWDQLLALQNEREAIKDAEADLLERVTALESREGMLPLRYQQTATEKSRLEDEISTASRTRQDIARELESLNAEMAHMIRALEAVADDGEPDDDDYETRVSAPSLRLVGAGPPPLHASRSSSSTQPPPPPPGRRKLPPTEVLHGASAGSSRPRVSPTLPMMPSSPAVLALRSGATMPATAGTPEEAPTTRHNVVSFPDSAQSIAPSYSAFAQNPATPTWQPAPAGQAASAPSPAAPSFQQVAFHETDDFAEDYDEDLFERRARKTRRRLWLGIVTATAALVGLSVQILPQTQVWPEIQPSVAAARSSMLAMVDQTPARSWVPASWRSTESDAPRVAPMPSPDTGELRSAGIATPPPAPSPIAPSEDPSDPLGTANAGTAVPAAEDPTESPAAPEEPAGEVEPEGATEVEAGVADTQEAAAEEPPEEAREPAPKASRGSKKSSRKASKASRKRRKASASKRSAPSPAAAKPSAPRTSAEPPASPMPKKRKDGVSVGSSSDPLFGL